MPTWAVFLSGALLGMVILDVVVLIAMVEKDEITKQTLKEMYKKLQWWKGEDAK